MPASDQGRLHDAERPRITDLLPTHQELLQQHQPRLVELAPIAVDQQLDVEGWAFIIADAAGMFGLSCIGAKAGWRFLVKSADGVGVMVIPIDVDGFLAIRQLIRPSLDER